MRKEERKERIPFFYLRIYESLKSSSDNGRIDNKKLNQVISNIHLKMDDWKFIFFEMMRYGLIINNWKHNYYELDKLTKKESDALTKTNKKCQYVGMY
jgi:hypothetical protein